MNQIATFSNVVERLQNLISRELNKGVPDPVLHQIGNYLKEIIRSKDAKRKSDEQLASKFGTEIMKLFYDLEDLVESTIREIVAKRKGSFFIRRGSSKQIFIQSLQTELVKLKNLLEEHSRFSDQQQHHGDEMEPEKGDTRTDHASQKEHEKAQNVIGKEQEMKLVEALTKGSSQLSFIFICGVSGTGKTKLAKRVLKNPLVWNHFGYMAWVHVSQFYSRRDLLLHIFDGICGPPTDNVMEMPDQDLAEIISNSILEDGKRYLIVLDDVWSVDAWLSIRNALPSDNNGSRILVTTQTEGLASAIDQPNTHTFDMEVNKNKKILMDQNEEKLRDALKLRKNKQLSFISICGMDGSGKTKLAKRIFYNKDISNEFEAVAWADVSLAYHRRNILLDILAYICGPPTDMGQLMYLSDEELAELTYKNLIGKRYLIVLDDIFSLDTFFSIGIAFPSDDNGSRILLTTRNKEVASAVGGETIDMSPSEHKNITTSAESWESLKDNIGELDEGELKPELENICAEILTSSGSGESLVYLILDMVEEMTAAECKEMLLDILSRKVGQKKIADVLEASYYALPLHLRPCLLYLGNFQKVSEIETDMICQLWIAEGLVPDREGERMMDVAAKYLNDLERRGWVQIQVEENLSRGRFKSCSLNDAIIDLCVRKLKEYASKVKEYKDLDSWEENEIMTSEFRCAVTLGTHERSNTLFRKLDYLRCLLLFSSCKSEEGFMRPRKISNLEQFVWLRVLCLRGVDFKDGKFPKAVEKLIYLRYLSFRECYLVELSSSIRKMLYLQTLDLRVRNECKLIIPNVLDNLKRLKYLYLPLACRTPCHSKKLNLGNLEELEIVENFDTSVCDIKDIAPSKSNKEDISRSKLKKQDISNSKLNKLTDLSVSVEGNNLKTLLDCLDEQSQLPRVSLDVRNFDCYTANRISIKERLFKSSHFQALGVEGYLGNMPDFQNISSSMLTKIVLNGSEFKDDPMQVLQELHQLEVLVLETEAYVGKKMKCSSTGFPELRYLKLSKLYILEKWEVENSGKSCGMKNLGTLVIQNCAKLQKLPRALEVISGLRKLEINSMSPEFVGRIRRSAGTGGEDFHLIQHVLPNVKIDGQPLSPELEETISWKYFFPEEPELGHPGHDPESSSRVPQSVEENPALL